MKFDHYYIRLLKPDDLHPYFEMVEKNRKRLEDFFTGTVSRTKTLEDTADFLQEISQKIISKTYFPFIIINEINNAIIGFVDVKNIDWTIPKAELGCYMDEANASKGIATKAFNIVCEHCFKELGFEKLFLRTHENNTAARRGAESCGFKVEGIITRDYKTTAGELVDLVYYGRVRN